MQRFLTVSLIAAAIIHLLPLAGVTSSKALTALYGLPFEESNLQILMRHRAVLFGILGGLLFYAAFFPWLQGVAILAGLLSAGAFLWIAFEVGGYNAMLNRVVLADVVAFCFLLLAAVLRFASKGT
ncbi:MAG TPA: phosphopantetheine adenylyltransferase [Noviherbaspirillum sp.]